jgi:hypothetical protein
MSEYINLKEHINWLKSLETDGKITNLKIERLPDGNIEILFKPVKAIEFKQLDFKLKNNQ